jgi:sucrose phosphorylase
VKNILQKEDINFIIERAREHGAFISYKTGTDGNKEPYEINTTWFSALNQDNSNEDIAFQVKRFVASRSISLVLRGVPGIYFHGLIGTCNDTETVLETKTKRDINRKVIDLKTLNEEQKDPNSKLSHIILQGARILEIRVRQSAFHPNGDQHVLSVSPDVFTVLRVSPDASQHILTMTNITNRVSNIEVPLALLNTQEIQWYDLVSTKQWRAENQLLTITLQPYDVTWLIPFAEIEESIDS